MESSADFSIVDWDCLFWLAKASWVCIGAGAGAVAEGGFCAGEDGAESTEDETETGGGGAWEGRSVARFVGADADFDSLKGLCTTDFLPEIAIQIIGRRNNSTATSAINLTLKLRGLVMDGG